MNVAEWILVAFLSVALLCFLIVAIVLAVKLIHLADEAKKIVITGQSIATKTDDIVDNVKGMTSVGGIVKTFAHRVMANQERRYAAQDAARAAADQMAEAAIEQAFAATAPQSDPASQPTANSPSSADTTTTARSQSASKSQSAAKSARPTKKSTTRK